MKGKLTGNAVRVPIPNVSMAILNLNLKRETTAGEMNDYLRGISVQSPMQDQIDYTASTELVSSDLVGSTHAGVVDSQATIVDGNRLVLYVWYDNEAGYSTQVIRLMQEVAGMKYPNVPA
jgi:glyceraldehyde 3-phosphate dehydrogenase